MIKDNWVNTTAKMLTDTIDKHILPSNVRMYRNQFIPQYKPLTESSFTNADLDALRRAVANQMQYNNEYSKLGIPTKNAINYGSYTRKQTQGNPRPDSWEDSTVGMIVNSIIDPDYRMSSTIGRANYYVQPNGDVVIKDTYDFANLGNRHDSNKLYQFLHDYGQKYGTPYSFNINLGNPNDWR